MSASRAAVILACATLLLPAPTPARADIIHLKNGGTIAADSWEVRGDVLLIRQGGGRITVPRADIESIEAVAGHPRTSPARPPGRPPHRSRRVATRRP